MASLLDEDIAQQPSEREQQQQQQQQRDNDAAAPEHADFGLQLAQSEASTRDSARMYFTVRILHGSLRLLQASQRLPPFAIPASTSVIATPFVQLCWRQLEVMFKRRAVTESTSISIGSFTLEDLLSDLLPSGHASTPSPATTFASFGFVLCPTAHLSALRQQKLQSHDLDSDEASTPPPLSAELPPPVNPSRFVAVVLPAHNKATHQRAFFLFAGGTVWAVCLFRFFSSRL